MAGVSGLVKQICCFMLVVHDVSNDYTNLKHARQNTEHPFLDCKRSDCLHYVVSFFAVENASSIVCLG